MSSEVVCWISTEATTTRALAPSSSGAVSEIPSRFGQLIALASLGRAEVEQKGKIGRLVLGSWQSAYLQWLCLDLKEQASDLRGYAEWLGVEVDETLEKQFLADLNLLVPQDSSAAERLLFLSDTEILFQLAGVRRRSGSVKLKQSMVGFPRSRFAH
ncbi:MAG TPA: hypothetical protein VLE22_18545 [Bryobacteraceae bacterium]|nr:hypothetical protein [Bryobacteraceae bacterium]